MIKSLKTQRIIIMKKTLPLSFSPIIEQIARSIPSWVQSKKQLGQFGEQLVWNALQSQHHTMLHKNFYLKRKEADIISRYQGQLFITEVKTRKTDRTLHPRQVLSYRQERHYRLLLHELHQFYPQDPTLIFNLAIVTLGAQAQLVIYQNILTGNFLAPS